MAIIISMNISKGFVNSVLGQRDQILNVSHIDNYACGVAIMSFACATF